MHTKYLFFRHPDRLGNQNGNEGRRKHVRELHQWYLKACAEGYIMLATRIKHTHFYRGMDDIWIDFDHFFLFHQDAVDKSLVSVWSMQVFSVNCIL